MGDLALVPDLAHVLSHLLSPRQRSHEATPFHGACEPPLSIQAYLERIAKYTECGDECLIIGSVYIHGMAKRNPKFIINRLSIHRLVLVSMTLAIKFHNDAFYTNTYYARVGGLKVDELNMLEKRFLQLIDWRLHVTHEEYEQSLAHLCIGPGADKRSYGASFAPH